MWQLLQNQLWLVSSTLPALNATKNTEKIAPRLNHRHFPCGQMNLRTLRTVGSLLTRQQGIGTIHAVQKAAKSSRNQD